MPGSEYHRPPRAPLHRQPSRVGRWARSAVYLAAYNFISLALPLVQSIVLTRVLSQDDYGSYAFLMAFVLVLDFTSLPGVGTAVLQAAARGETGTVRPATTARLKSSLAGAGVLGGAAAYSLARGEQVSAALFLVAALAFPFYFPFTNFLFYWNGRRDFPRLLSSQALHLTLTHVPILVVAAWTRDFRIVLVTHLVTAPLVRFLVNRAALRDPPPDAPIDEDYLRYGRRLTMVSILGALELHLDRILVGLWFSPAALASYHIGKTVGVSGRTLWTFLGQYAVPSLASRGKTLKRFPPALFGLLALYIAALVGLYLVIPWIVVLAYPSEYEGSIVAAQWFVLAALASSPAAICDVYLQVAGRLTALVRIRLVKSAAYLAALYGLVGAFGIAGLYYAVFGMGLLHSVVGVSFLLVSRGRDASGRGDGEGLGAVDPESAS